MSEDDGTIWHYLGLLVGMAFIGSYLWYLLFPFGLTVYPDQSQTQILVITAILLVVATIALGFAKSRNERVVTTMASGALAGVHGYLDLYLFSPGAGIILFAWISFGLLLAFAVLAWLQE
jgi:hypothetical protein